MNINNEINNNEINNNEINKKDNNKVSNMYYIIFNTGLTLLIFAILFVLFWKIILKQLINIFGDIYLLATEAFFIIVVLTLSFYIVSILNKKFSKKIYNINNYEKIKKISIPIIVFIVLFIRYHLILLLIIGINDIVVNREFKKYNYELDKSGGIQNNKDLNIKIVNGESRTEKTIKTESYDLGKLLFIIGLLLSFIMLLSTILPYYMCTYTDASGLVHTSYYSFISILGIVFVVLVLVIFYILIKNYIIYNKNVNAKPIKCIWILINSMLLLLGPAFMKIIQDLQDFHMNESGYWPYFKNCISYYLYPISNIALIIFSVICIYKCNGKKN